jgi:hypothetical protein
MPRRLMAHVLLVTAFELRDPVAMLVLVESRDSSIHVARLRRRFVNFEF